MHLVQVEVPATSHALAAALPLRLTQQQAGAELARLTALLVQQPSTPATLDAQALQVFDSSALALLLELRRRLLAQGKTLQIQHWPPRLLALASLYGVSELLHV